MNRKKEELYESSIMLSGAREVISESLVTDMEMIFQGHSDGEFAEMKEDYKKMKTEYDRRRLLFKIDTNIDRVKDGMLTVTQNYPTQRQVQVILMSAILLPILGAVAAPMYRRHELTKANAKGILRRTLSELRSLRKKVESKKLKKE